MMLPEVAQRIQDEQGYVVGGSDGLHKIPSVVPLRDIDGMKVRIISRSTVEEFYEQCRRYGLKILRRNYRFYYRTVAE